MYKDGFISNVKTTKNALKKHIDKGGYAGPAKLINHPDRKMLREITEFNLREQGRILRILRSAVEVHVPNVDEIVNILIREGNDPDLGTLTAIRVMSQGHELRYDKDKPLLSFSGIRSPFEEIMISFLDRDGNRCAALVYPWETHKGELDILDVSEGSYVVEYLIEKGDQVCAITGKGTFTFDSVGMLVHVGVMDSLIDEMAGFDFRDINFDLVTWAGTVFVALSRILECKNVSLKKHEAAVAGKEREYMRQNGFVCSDDFYTLVVKIGGKEVEYASSSPGTGPKKRFHLCRGHYATYTEEKKLFGRYVGKYWVPEHFKGNPDLGVIEKDYLIES